MAEKLTDKEALTRLNQFVSQWRSFGWIAGILEQAMAAREFLDTLDKEKESRQKELDLMAEARTAAENQVKSANTAAKRAYDDTEAVKEELNREMAKLKQEKDEAVADFTEVKARLEHERNHLEATLVEKNRQLTHVRQQLNTLKEQL